MSGEWGREASWTPWWAAGVLLSRSCFWGGHGPGGRGEGLPPWLCCQAVSVFTAPSGTGGPVGAALCDPVCLNVRAGGWASWQSSPCLTEKVVRLAWHLLPLGHL